MKLLQPERTDEQTQGSAWSWQDWAALVLLLVGTVLAVRPLWQPGLPNSTDLLLAIYRVFELDRSWQSGVFFPRIGPDLNFGYGAPLFQFYPPLLSYVIFAFYSLGFGYIEATKLVLSFQLLLGATGVYAYLRWFIKLRLPALAAGFIYLYAPYILLVLYERGAAAEGMALALLPWLLWSCHRLFDKRKFSALAFAALMVALTLLAHNITALFVLPAVVLYLAAWIVYERRLDVVKRLLLAILLGVGISAFYWMPAIFELGYTRTEAIMLAGEAQVDHWLLPSLAETFQPSLFVAYLGDTRFRFALWPLLSGVVLLLGWKIYSRRVRFTLAFLSLSTLIVLLLQLQASALIWSQVPLLRFIQFPWRLFGIATLSWTLGIGLAFAGMWQWLETRRQMSPASSISLGAVTVWMGAMVVVTYFFSTASLRVADLPYQRDIDSSQINLPALFEIGRFETALFTDYTTTWMQVRGGQISQPRSNTEPLLPALDSEIQLKVLRQSANAIDIVINANTAFPLRYHKIYFPGWRAYADGELLPTYASGQLGLVTADIPAGQHNLTLRFGRTPLRLFADLLSAISLLCLLAIAAKVMLTNRRFYLFTFFALTGIAIVCYLLFAHASSASRPTEYFANLDDRIHVVGYELPQTTVARGARLPIRLYWFATRTPAANLKLFVHLIRPDDSGKVAQLDQEPAIGYNPTSRWEAGELIADRYELALESTVPPGKYLVTFGLYDPVTGQNLPIRSGTNALPGDRLMLSEITVR